MKIKTILSALLLMVSTVASAQYLNVKLEDGSVRSFKTTPNMKVSFGDKKGLEPTEVLQTLFFNGYTVTVKLAENTPSSVVALSAYVDDDFVKIKAWSAMNVALKCTRDDGVAVSAPETSGDIQIFTISDITKDVVVTVEYASWDEDNIINGHPCVRLAGLYWATENVSNEDLRSAVYDNYCDVFQQDKGQAKQAAENWGKEGSHQWILPHSKHWQALINNCKWTWKDSYPYNGKNVSGYLVEGNKENGEGGNSIFLPAVPWWYQTFSTQLDSDYWASDGHDQKLYILRFHWTGYHEFWVTERTSIGAVALPVRPVAE